MTLAEAKPDIAGKNILIVEDELLLALDLQSIVEDLGAVVLGPASSIETAMALLGKDAPDAALLDANLRGSRVTPVAEALKQRNIPFVMVTGYGRLAMAEAILEEAPRVRKPFSPEDIRAALADLLDTSP
jgi:CheY-like chemotaxis protein